MVNSEQKIRHSERETVGHCKNCISAPYCKEWGELSGCGGYLDLKRLEDWMNDSPDLKKYVLCIGLDCFGKKDTDGIGRILCLMGLWASYRDGGEIETLQEFRNECEEVLLHYDEKIERSE